VRNLHRPIIEPLMTTIEYDRETGQLTFDVVRNDHDDQYSIWPLGRDLPDGWRLCGFRGERSACLDHIEMIRQDLTPVDLESTSD
jgi:MbtH protein